MPVTERDRAVWSAYIGSALALPHVQDNPDALEALSKAQAAAAAGKTSGLAKALEGQLDAIVAPPTAHPARQGRARAAIVNIEFVIEQISGTKPSQQNTTSGSNIEVVVHDITNHDDSPVADDGKVDCPCGKRHDADAKVLAKHQAKAAAAAE